MKKILAAFEFLTSISFKRNTKPDADCLSESVVFFPLVGLLVGLFLYYINNLLAVITTDFIRAVIIVLLLAIITGGLHLDGLADMVDGLYAGKTRADILRIMRDSFIGSMGVIGIVFIILLKVGLIHGLHGPVKNKVLIVFPMLSRWSMVLSVSLFKYARIEGKAKIFFETANSKKLIFSTAYVLAVVIFLFRLPGIFSLVFILGFTCLFNLYISRKIGGLTGDTLGAINEVNEIIAVSFLMRAL